MNFQTEIEQVCASYLAYEMVQNNECRFFFTKQTDLGKRLEPRSRRSL